MYFDFFYTRLRLRSIAASVQFCTMSQVLSIDVGSSLKRTKVLMNWFVPIQHLFRKSISLFKIYFFEYQLINVCVVNIMITDEIVAVSKPLWSWNILHYPHLRGQKSMWSPTITIRIVFRFSEYSSNLKFFSDVFFYIVCLIDTIVARIWWNTLCALATTYPSSLGIVFVVAISSIYRFITRLCSRSFAVL